MEESLFSPSWYRVSRLKPRLREHAQVHRHEYGGEVWYVLQDHASGRHYRFNPVAYHLIGLMDGTLTVQEVWESSLSRFGDDAPTQGDMVRILSQLHAADVLLCDVPPDTADLLRRHQKAAGGTWKANLRSPLAFRIPLFDPDSFLSRTGPLVAPLFSWLAAAVWLATVGTGLVLAVRHWPELTHNPVDRILSGQNLLLLWLVYPVIKAIHELGHAFAVKRWGGEVHEMGIMFIVLMPLPYVDASASISMPERRRRMAVSAAGIMVELFIAALALFCWLNLDQGFARSLAFNVLFVGSVSTVMFNGNPLLRYDGYYILSDALGIPNLGQRSLQLLGWNIKRFVLGVKREEPPHVAKRELPWLAVYSVASFIYRGFVYASIILFISGKFFLVGILLGLWAAGSMVVVPLGKKIHWLFTTPALREGRARAVATVALVLSVLAAALFLAPFPLWTRAEGVVWVPEGSLVRAGGGFVDTIPASPDARVGKGDVLIQCRDPLLGAQERVLIASQAALQARYDAQILQDRVEARVTGEKLDEVGKELVRVREQEEELTIRSTAEGVFVLPGAVDLPGRYLPKGVLVGYVLEPGEPTVRVVVKQSDVDLVRGRTRSIAVRVKERLEEALPATLLREVPGAVENLPSTVLGSAGGGAIAIDPRDEKGTRAVERLFQFDLLLPASAGDAHPGGRVFVRFDHGTEPLGFQWVRSLRQLFLKRFNV